MTDVVPTEIGPKHSRWQFSLRAIFLLTLSAAALAAIARVATQLDVLVVGVAAAIWSTHGVVRRWRRTRRLTVTSLALLAASWCACYVVGVGPAIMVADRFIWTLAPLRTIYAPLAWMYDHTPLHDALAWYAKFWEDLF